MKLLTNIKFLAQTRREAHLLVRGQAMDELPTIENAWLALKDGLIHDYGSMETLDLDSFESFEKVDLEGKSVLPAWVDSHTHIVFANWRDGEFEDRINGLSYQEIAENGGGILNSARKLQRMTEDELYEQSSSRLRELISLGTGGIEIKSGYGLNLESELKMLRVIQRLKAEFDIPIKSTFLGAHAVPEEFKGNTQAYVDHVITHILPKVTERDLAEYIDVFCEDGYFSSEQTAQIIAAGKDHGLKAKIHVNQFTATGGVGVCCDNDAISVDHLEELNDSDVEALKNRNGQTIAVALPSCSFFLGIPYTPVKRLMDAGVPVALATDFNPGSTPSGNMNFVLSLACIVMKMTPAQAINAMTINGAAAIELSNELGSITPGKRANLIVTNEIHSLSFLPYAFGSNHIDHVLINGEKFRQ